MFISPLDTTARRHILIFEPRLGGHHLTWLRYVTEDFLSAGFQLSLAVDNLPGSQKIITKYLADLLPDVQRIPVYNHKGKLRRNTKLKTLALCLRESGAHEAFMGNLDHIASNCLRAAAFGVLPPQILKGRLSGVYFRPRFLANQFWPFGNFLKHLGFQRLAAESWFKKIFIMDEYLINRARKEYKGIDFSWLPDPWDGDFSGNRDVARNLLQIPKDRVVLLNYGLVDRRKGLHLVIQAMLSVTAHPDIFLLCAGQVVDYPELITGLKKLEMQGKAKVMNRYVSDKEEILCFNACDMVLLPYIKHFGSSGVLSRATAAGKPVLASNEGLLGTRVQNHNLGLLFQSGSVESLEKVIREAAIISPEALARFQFSALKYAHTCNREAFRSALLSF